MRYINIFWTLRKVITPQQNGSATDTFARCDVHIPWAGIVIFTTVFFQKVQRILSDEQMLASFDLSIQSLSEEEKKELATNLSISTQKRIALDLLKHVTSPTARPAFDTLFDHAYTWLTIRLETNIHIDRVTGLKRIYCLYLTNSRTQTAASSHTC